MNSAEKNQNPIWITSEMLELLKINLHMSKETWEKLIAVDPAGWREMLGGSDGRPS